MRHHVTRVLPYSPDQLFELVGDVAYYPEFIPWITFMRVGEVRQAGDGRTAVRAEAGVGFSFLTERFTTQVTRDPARREIAVDLLAGPFKHLSNNWKFRPHPAGCEVVFDIDFAFKTRLLDLLLKANFGLAVDRLIACFEARARALYGPPSALGAAPVSPGAPSGA